MRAVSTLAAVQATTIVNRANTQSSSAGSPIGFSVGYFFAGIFSYFPAVLEWNA